MQLPDSDGPPNLTGCSHANSPISHTVQMAAWPCCSEQWELAALVTPTVKGDIKGICVGNEDHRGHVQYLPVLWRCH